MELQLSDIREITRKGRNKAALQRAVSLQNRVKFHAETHVCADRVGDATNNFLSFVKNLLPTDKYKMFTALMRYPLLTNKVTNVCFDRLSRVFDGRNPVYNYTFVNEEAKVDWERYRVQVLGEPGIYSSLAWDYYKTEYNAVAIIDMPAETVGGELPHPYFYFASIGDIIDVEVDKRGAIEWIITRQKNEVISVIDGQYYRLFRKTSDGGAGELIAERQHELGYCPATFLTQQAITPFDPIVKVSPLTKELDALDWYLFYSISKRHLDLYGSYPIYSGYAQNCNYTDDTTGDYCDGGFLRDREGHWHYDNAGQLLPCPKCGRKRIVGAGTFVDIPVPNEKGEEGDYIPDMRNPVQMLSVDKKSLDYSVVEEERLRNSIITAVCGTDAAVQSEAVNEKQVEASFESQTTILGRIKQNFEQLQQFIDSTVCRLRYGEEFVSASINFGTDFYLTNVKDLQENYATLKGEGVSVATLDALDARITETQFRNNPALLTRMHTIADLEPFRHYSIAEVAALVQQGAATAEELRVKAHIDEYIRRFERENTDIVEFGKLLPYDKKINIIKDKFKEYAREQESL